MSSQEPAQGTVPNVAVADVGIATTAGKRRLARGLNASPGVATGVVMFTPDEAVLAVANGQAVIFVRTETSAEDMPAMKVASGILTSRGGLTGDAAIVARSLGKPCVAGCSSVAVDYRERTMSVLVDQAETGTWERVTIRSGQTITLDGARGEVFEG